jgi:hypothetical protein
MKQILTLLLLVAAFAAAQSNNSKQIVDLRGNWKFEIGDDKKYADPNFNDKKWGEIFVPAEWENEGYPGYDGYAWYRKKFVIPASAQGKSLYFHGGYIDDACIIYINGHRIGGKGFFPPKFETAYDQEEIFLIPNEFLNFNQDNIVSIRVYDDFRYGGITRGKIGVFEHLDEVKFVVHLPELWKFKTGDNEQWSNPTLDDSKWQELIATTMWDYQGFEDYDGFAWYRVSFDVPQNVENEKLFLLLGKIDDIDEAYINGVKIGNTGHMEGSRWKDKIREEYQEVRIYRIPNSVIKFNQKNLLAVRVYDKMKFGGLNEGPVGIITEKEYRQWNRKQRWNGQNNGNNFDNFLDEIFRKLK